MRFLIYHACVMTFIMHKTRVVALVMLSIIIILILIGIAFYPITQNEIRFSQSVIIDSPDIYEDPVCALFQGDLYLGYEVKKDNGTTIEVGKFSNLNLSEISIVSAHLGDNTNPFLYTWQDSLYLFWDTTDDIATNGKDRDIAMRSFDGTKWSETVDISSWDKTEDSEDTWPQAVAFGGELHLIWENETSILHRKVDTSGTLSEVLSIGEGWGADIEVLGSKMYVAWTTYYDPTTRDTSVHLREYTNSWSTEVVSVNPSIGNLDYFPSLEGFDDKLYLAWVTKDKNISKGESDDDIVLRSYNPAFGDITASTAWDPIIDLSGTDEDWDDWPVLFTHNGKLHISWQTWNHATNNGDYGDDLVLRSLEGDVWSSPLEVTNTTRQSGDIYERGFSAISNGDDYLMIFYQSKGGKQAGVDWQIRVAFLGVARMPL